MPSWIPAVMLIVSCGVSVPAGYAVTDNGMCVPKSDLAEFNRAEGLAIRIAGELGLDVKEYTKSMSGWKIEWREDVDAKGYFYSDWHGYDVAGYADINTKTMVLGRVNLCKSAYFHELFHIYDKGATYNHEGWDKNGWNDADTYFTQECVQ